MRKMFTRYFELSFWAAALFMLALFPSLNNFSLCPLAALGISWCPGCGLGRAIHLAFCGSIVASLKMHPLGIPAIIIIIKRIITLIKLNFITIKKSPNESYSAQIFI